MHSDNPARGFSFLIADTPAPEAIETSSGEEDAEASLDLDLADLAKKPPEPPEGEYRQRMPTILDSAPPPPVGSPEVPRDQAEDEPKAPASRREKSETGAKQAARAIGGGHSKAPQPRRALLGQKFGRMSAERPAEPPRGRRGPPTSTQAPLGRKPPVTGHRARFTDPALEPSVKKIEFPRRQRRAAPQPSPAPRTRFAEGGFRVEARADDALVRTPMASTKRRAPRDEARAASPGPAPPLLNPPDDLAPPEDLPMANIHPGTDVGWGSETPTAAELWAQARTGLFQAGKLAKTASEKGWEKGWSAATVMSAALRARLEQARVAQPPDEEVGAVSAEFAADPAPASQAGRAPAAESHRPSVAVKAKTGRSVPAHLLLRGARSLAAPLAACAAAAIVYQAGSHFLGSASDIALSKSAPAVPELGELQSPAVAPATRTGASAPPGKSAGSGPPAMQVESTEMPQGLSWPGKGLIEVVTAEDELIYVDGVFTGRGPLRRVPVTPGEHEVRIKQDGSERSGAVSVELDRCTRAVFAQSP